jgi:hypothetical protein
MDPPQPRCAVHVLTRHSRDTRAAAKGGFLWMAAAAAHVHLTSIPTRPLPLTSISRPFDTRSFKILPPFLPRAQAPQTRRQLMLRIVQRCRGALGLGLRTTRRPNPSQGPCPRAHVHCPFCRERCAPLSSNLGSKRGPAASWWYPRHSGIVCVAPLPAGPGRSLQIRLQSHWHQPTRRSHCPSATCQRPNAATKPGQVHPASSVGPSPAARFCNGRLQTARALTPPPCMRPKGGNIGTPTPPFPGPVAILCTLFGLAA